MNVYFKKIHPFAVLPSYANPGDAGMDLCCVEECTLHPGEHALIHTGLQMQLPRGTEAQLRPRSGLALKYGITVLNTPGTIDEGYRGEVGVILINHGQQDFVMHPQMAIAQIVIMPIVQAKVYLVEALEDSMRGESGFGSTGENRGNEGSNEENSGKKKSSEKD